MSLTIRRGIPADAAALAELAARTFHDTFAADNRAEDMALHLATAYGPEQQGRELRDPEVTTLLVVSGSTLAGFAQLKSGTPPACVVGAKPLELARFYIARDWHGQGVAQMLMQQVEHECHQCGAQTLWLGVWERNPRAIAFYCKCGFRDVGTHVFMVGTDAQTDRIMTRALVSEHARLVGTSSE